MATTDLLFKVPFLSSYLRGQFKGGNLGNDRWPLRHPQVTTSRTALLRFSVHFGLLQDSLCNMGFRQSLNAALVPPTCCAPRGTPPVPPPAAALLAEAPQLTRSHSWQITGALTWLHTGWSFTAAEALWAQSVSRFSNPKDGWVTAASSSMLKPANSELTVFLITVLNSGSPASTWSRTKRLMRTWSWRCRSLSPSRRDRWAADVPDSEMQLLTGV